MSTMPVWLGLIGCIAATAAGAQPGSREISLANLSETPTSFQAPAGDSGGFTWWLPEGADRYVVPISGGVIVDSIDKQMLEWLKQQCPWGLVELPSIGAAYGDSMVVVIVPWPHYAELVFDERIGIRFTFPKGREGASPREVVALTRKNDPLEVALALREWRRSAKTTGVIPRACPLAEKARKLPRVARLYGAPQIYLWGPALFSRHDVERRKWVAFARALRDAPADSVGGRVVARFGDSERASLLELAKAEDAAVYLTTAVALAIDRVLSDNSLSGALETGTLADITSRNRSAFAEQFSQYVNDPATWGDGVSVPMLDALAEAGIEHALLLIADLYGRSLRPDVAAHADELGFLLGPYDSYHSVHAPDAPPDHTWETAQFDRAAYEDGRVINADGTGHAGFKGRGYHFSPQAAWPYVQKRVTGIVSQVPYSTWFIDCDATGECFDDFHPAHTATRLQDTEVRRQRLQWLRADKGLVVGSEGGSILFADVIDYGQGVHTPYIGHLDPGFRDRQSPYFMGRYWPPDGPDVSFKPIPVPPALVTPYFDPRVRVPLYQAALGDEVIVTHHWSFDSLKFSDTAQTRELLEILYMVPPVYHLNRAHWPARKDRIVRHTKFWGPIHQELATAPLTRFEWLSEDRLVQRTTFRTARGEVQITANFADSERLGLPPLSCTIAGPIDVRDKLYRTTAR